MMEDTIPQRIEENVRVRSYEVDHNFVGWRLDEYLANRIDGMSRTLAARVIKEGNATVAPRRRAKPSTRLRLDDVVTLRQELPPEEVQDHQVAPLFRDAHLLILDKPAGMLVHETATTRLNTITHYLLRQGLPEAEPVHRIDRETSGVLVCALTAGVVAPLRGLFAGDDPRKMYRALVLDPDHRWPPGERATLTTPLGFDPTSRLPMRMAKGDLSATTHVQALRRIDHPYSPMADLRIRIESGRQHQIRVHLFMEGTPIAGDKLYGQTDDFFTDICDHPDDQALLARLPFPRHALHAWRIELTPPITDDRIAVEAPLPTIWGPS